MELNHVKSGFTTAIEKAIKKDISDIICMLMIDYDIKERGTTNAATKEQLYQKIMAKFEMGDAYCCAVTKNGSKCTRKVQVGKTRYCGTHANIEILERMYEKKQNNVIRDHVTKKEKVSISNDILSKMRKVFIEDSFFLVDEEYIYDKDTYEKVGYVEKDSEDKKFVLTDDPFILNTI
jgi:hypothetical protein